MAHSQNFGTRVSEIPVSSGLLQLLCNQLTRLITYFHVL